jgi:hypothetical protein
MILGGVFGIRFSVINGHGFHFEKFPALYGIGVGVAVGSGVAVSGGGGVVVSVGKGGRVGVSVGMGMGVIVFVGSGGKVGVWVRVGSLVGDTASVGVACFVAVAWAAFVAVGWDGVFGGVANWVGNSPSVGVAGNSAATVAVGREVAAVGFSGRIHSATKPQA